MVAVLSGEYSQLTALGELGIYRIKMNASDTERVNRQWKCSITHSNQC